MTSEEFFTPSGPGTTMRFCGNGGHPAETLAFTAKAARLGYDWEGAHRFPTWDGSLVARMSTRDWINVQLAMGYRYDVRIVGDRRAVDLSELMPIAALTFLAFADERIPVGYAIIETPEGREIGRVVF